MRAIVRLDPEPDRALDQAFCVRVALGQGSKREPAGVGGRWHRLGAAADNVEERRTITNRCEWADRVVGVKLPVSGNILHAPVHI